MITPSIYPVDILINSFVGSLRSANAHLFDERSSEGHDLTSCICEERCLY